MAYTVECQEKEVSAIDLERLMQFYENEGEEELRLQTDGAHYLELLTAQRYLEKHLRPNSRILDHCAGTGVYAFWLAGKGHRVTAGDIVPRNVELMRRQQPDNPPLEQILECDALDLSRFPDNSFDAALLMGALYHLHSAADRERAIRESLRVLRPGGLLAATYMNRYAVILNNCSGSLDNLDEILEFLRHGTEGVFYTATPGESEKLVESQDARILAHVALDGLSNFLHATAGLLDDAGLARYRRYHLAVCEERSLLGAGYHNMILAEKTPKGGI